MLGQLNWISATHLIFDLSHAVGLRHIAAILLSRLSKSEIEIPVRARVSHYFAHFHTTGTGIWSCMHGGYRSLPSCSAHLGDMAAHAITFPSSVLSSVQDIEVALNDFLHRHSDPAIGQLQLPLVVVTSGAPCTT